MVILRGNYIFVEKGSPCFQVSSNYTNYLELGRKGITKYYLEARIENNEFKISGTLLDRNGEILCNIRDNFVEPTANCKKEMTSSGYRISDNKQLVFEIVVDENRICHLRGKIYGESGLVVAEEKDSDFVIMKGPAVLGRSGNSVGIAIG